MSEPRKKVAGEIRDKGKTMLKLINAVGEIIKTEGYTGLGVNSIARKAEVNKKLIYRYFTNVNNLIEIYVHGKDYWIGLAENLDEVLKDFHLDNGEMLVKSILKKQMSFFYEQEEMQKIIIWEISEKNRIIKELSAKREDFGEEVFKLVDPYFEGSNMDVRPMLALLVAGVYYMVLQAKSNGNTFCGVDINEPHGMQRVMNSLDKMVGLMYANR